MRTAPADATHLCNKPQLTVPYKTSIDQKPLVYNMSAVHLQHSNTATPNTEQVMDKLCGSATALRSCS
jgi:hypothetical protein